MKAISTLFNFSGTICKLAIPAFFLGMSLTSLNSCQKSTAKSISAPVVDTPVFEYLVYFSYKDPNIGGSPGQLYTDSADFELTVKLVPEAGTHPQKMAIASIHGINNYAPTVVPITETYPVSPGVTNTITFLPDPIGIYNIDSVGVLYPFIKADSIIGFNFYNSAGMSAGLSVVQNPYGNKVTSPSIPLAAGQVVSTPIAFRIRKTEQYLADEERGYYYRFIPK